MKSLVTAVVLLGLAAAPASAARLDPSFSGDGRAKVGAPQGMVVPASVTTLPGGGLQIVGNTLGSPGSNLDGGDIAVVRLRRNGRPDGRLGTQGHRTIALPRGPVAIHAASTLADRRTLLVGSVGASRFDQDVVVVRLTADGQLDPGFGEGGVRTIDSGETTEAAGALAIAPDGSIVVAGTASLRRSFDPAADLLVTRLTADGAVDPSFGDGSYRRPMADGYTSLDVGGVTIQRDGAVLVATNLFSSQRGDNAIVMVRLLGNGTPDPSLTGDYASGPRGEARGLTLDPRSGRPVIVGFDQPEGGKSTFLVTSLLADLTRARSVTTPFGGARAFDAATAFAWDGAGRLLVAGTALREQGVDDGGFALARYRRDLTFDRAFGRGRAAFTPGWTAASAVTVQPDGRVVVVGNRVRHGLGSIEDGLRVARFLPPSNARLARPGR